MNQATGLAERAGGQVDLAIMDINLALGSNEGETAAALPQRLNIPSLFVSGNLDERARQRFDGSLWALSASRIRSARCWARSRFVPRNRSMILNNSGDKISVRQ